MAIRGPTVEIGLRPFAESVRGAGAAFAHFAREFEKTRRAFFTEARKRHGLSPVDQVNLGGFAVPDEYRDDLRDYVRYFGFGREAETPFGQALARAEKLLREWLSPTQLEQYERSRSFDVRGSSTGRTYTIEHGSIFNVSYTENGLQRSICFRPRGGLAIGDVMLAQKIALETDEAAALAIANTDQPNYRTVGRFELQNVTFVTLGEHAMRTDPAVRWPESFRSTAARARDLET